MNSLRPNVSISSKELTERRASQCVYCDLNKKRKSDRNYKVKKNSNKVISKTKQDKQRIIKGKEIFLQKFGNNTTKENIHNQVIKDNQKLDKQQLNDYNISEFNADRNSNIEYPGNNNLDLSENYIYNIGANINTDNLENGTGNFEYELTNDLYDTYNFFKRYPYILDSDGKIDYSRINSERYSNTSFIQANTSKTIYRDPKTLLKEPITLENADEFCQ
jgi:hypothetical protein